MVGQVLEFGVDPGGLRERGREGERRRRAHGTEAGKGEVGLQKGRL